MLQKMQMKGHTVRAARSLLNALLKDPGQLPMAAAITETSHQSVLSKCRALDHGHCLGVNAALYSRGLPVHALLIIAGHHFALLIEIRQHLKVVR